MRLFAVDRPAPGQLCEDLGDDQVADIVWSMDVAEYYLLLTRDRGSSTERFGRHLADAWCRLLLEVGVD